MKFFIKCLIAVLIIIIALALYDTVVNGLFDGDRYHPITEQMQEVSGE